MYRKILFAFILILNHSLLMGQIQAAEMPDEEHPFGHESPVHIHDHAHPEQVTHSHENFQSQSDYEEHLNMHDEQHQHGMHIHLSLALPDALVVDAQKQSLTSLPIYGFAHQNQTYAPPIPPPNA